MSIPKNSLINADCMQIFDQIEEDSIDLIVCDPPYGTVKGLKNLEGWKTTDTYWDVTLNTDVLFSKILKVLRLGGGTYSFFSRALYL